jgi:hypothetical protein
MTDPVIDQDVIAAGVIAAKKYANTITFMGVDVGGRITDTEYNELVAAVIKAVDDYRSGVSI